MRRAARGVSLIELVVAIAVFGIFLLIVTSVLADYRRLERRIRFGWLLHPDDMAVATRVRRDVLDSRGYPESFADEEQSPTTLLLAEAGARTVVWSFDADVVTREEWKGAVRVGTWTANATRRFEVAPWDAPDGTTGVHLVGRTGEGRVVVDRIFAPRPQ